MEWLRIWCRDLLTRGIRLVNAHWRALSGSITAMKVNQIFYSGDCPVIRIKYFRIGDSRMEELEVSSTCASDQIFFLSTPPTDIIFCTASPILFLSIQISCCSFCGATIIQSKWPLQFNATHCFLTFTLSPSQLHLCFESCVLRCVQRRGWACDFASRSPTPLAFLHSTLSENLRNR